MEEQNQNLNQPQQVQQPNYVQGQQNFGPQQGGAQQPNYSQQQGWGQPRQGYGMPNQGAPYMQQMPPQQMPPKKPRKSKQNGWKVAIAFICAVALIISVAGGTWLSSVLSDNKGGDFVLPQASTTEENMGYLDSVQNSSYESVSDIAEDVGQSVVTIIVSTDYDDYFMQYTGESLGSGIIIGEEDDKIYIATNFHVIDSASDVSIIAGSDNSATIQAYYQGADSDTDLAVIYIKKSEVPEEVRAEMKIATLGSSDDMRLGDLAIAIGSPVDKSFGNSVTAGTISGLERSVSFVDE